MARYIVTVVAGGQTASLLVVLSPSQLCSALVDTIKSRLPTVASRLGLATANGIHITLHLDSEHGLMTDTEDLLSDVLPGVKGTVYAVVDVSFCIFLNWNVVLQMTRWLTPLCGCLG
jgi:hypothetical protein